MPSSLTDEVLLSYFTMRSILLIVDLGHFNLKRIETINLKDLLAGEILCLCSHVLLDSRVLDWS